MITWQYERNGTKIVYTYEPNKRSYFIDEEAHKNIIEYEHHLELCRKNRKVPIHVDVIKSIADSIENDRDKQFIVKMLRDLIKIFDDEEKKVDF